MAVLRMRTTSGQTGSKRGQTCKSSGSIINWARGT